MGGEMKSQWTGLGWGRKRIKRRTQTETQKGDCYGRRQNRGQDWESEGSLHLLARPQPVMEGMFSLSKAFL